MHMKDILNLSVAKLKRLATLKSKIERLQSQLEAVVTNGAKAPAKTEPAAQFNLLEAIFGGQRAQQSAAQIAPPATIRADQH